MKLRKKIEKIFNSYDFKMYGVTKSLVVSNLIKECRGEVVNVVKQHKAEKKAIKRNQIISDESIEQIKEMDRVITKLDESTQSSIKTLLEFEKKIAPKCSDIGFDCGGGFDQKRYEEDIKKSAVIYKQNRV